MLINGAGWSQGFPRLLTTPQLSQALTLARTVGRGRFRTIADISCDISGGIEFVNRSCTIDDPFFYTDASGNEVVDTKTAMPGTPASTGVQVMSIDILPSELPLDASKHFSGALAPYLGALIRSYQGRTSEEDREALEALDRATIARIGKLRPKHEWLGDLVATHGGAAAESMGGDDKPDLDLGVDMGGLDTSDGATQHLSSSGDDLATTGTQRRKRVLLLGSGMVAKPAVDEIMKRTNVDLVVGAFKFASLAVRT